MTLLPPDAAAIAWDIDGTLIDSEPLHHRALVAASRNLETDLRIPEHSISGCDDIRSGIPTYPVTGSRRR